MRKIIFVWLMILDIVFYYGVEEKNGSYYFYIDYLAKKIYSCNKVDFYSEIKYFKEEKNYQTEGEAYMAMVEKEKKFVSDGFYLLESLVFEDSWGYSFGISYISQKEKKSFYYSKCGRK